MADVDKDAARLAHVQAGSFGNESLAHEQRNLNGAASADLVYFYKLPRGTKIVDGNVHKTNAAGAAGSTADIGIVAANGGSKGDPDFFVSGLALDGAATITRKSNAAPPVYLDDDDYWVVATIGGTAPGANDVLVDVASFFEFRGND